MSVKIISKIEDQCHRTRCTHCWAVLEFSSSDIIENDDTEFYEQYPVIKAYVRCPNCDKLSYLGYINHYKAPNGSKFVRISECR